jgi:hypothetical protein
MEVLFVIAAVVAAILTPAWVFLLSKSWEYGRLVAREKFRKRRGASTSAAKGCRRG